MVDWNLSKAWKATWSWPGRSNLAKSDITNSGLASESLNDFWSEINKHDTNDFQFHLIISAHVVRCPDPTLRRERVWIAFLFVPGQCRFLASLSDTNSCTQLLRHSWVLVKILFLYFTVYHITVYYSILHYTTVYYSIPQYITVYQSIPQYIIVYYSVPPQYITVYHHSIPS